MDVSREKCQETIAKRPASCKANRDAPLCEDGALPGGGFQPGIDWGCVLCRNLFGANRLDPKVGRGAGRKMVRLPVSTLGNLGLQ